MLCLHYIILLYTFIVNSITGDVYAIALVKFLYHCLSNFLVLYPLVLDYSSHSHLLFMLKVEGHDTVSKATSRGRLTLVDLAGSERISRSEATGIRLVEAAAINKSLSALGQVSLAHSIILV